MLFDVLATLLAILHSRRLLETSRRRAEDFPGVAVAEFERWRDAERRAHRLALLACVVKAVTGAFEYTFHHRYVPAAIAAGVGYLPYAVGISLLVGWLAALVAAHVMVRRARARAAEAGLDLTRPVATPSG